MVNWNSNQYMKFNNERTQPSVDLINRLSCNPNSILDIGCGAGNSTNQLYIRFSSANILGVDSSDDMLKKAENDYPNIAFKKCNIPDDLDSLDNFDLIFSNACLQWIPDHEKLLPKIMSNLNVDGIFAVQMPLVFQAPFYKILGNLVENEKWVKLKNINNFHNLSPEKTYDILSASSKKVTMWDTTYYHIVPNFDSVIDWYSGSGLRPYLDVLSEDERKEFLYDLKMQIKKEYTVRADSNIILKMPRLFFIAEK